MLSLNEWLADIRKAREGIVADIETACNVAIYPREDKEGNITGKVGIQINFPVGDQREYRIYGFLESTLTSDVTLDDVEEAI
jgi:hypothetical protein